MSENWPKISQPDKLLAEKIKSQAERLGFCALGIASAEVDEEMAKRVSSRPQPPFVSWEPEFRVSPHAWLKGARSVLVGAFPYQHRYPRNPQPSTGQGYISPFARAPDYHGLVSEKLRLLGEFIEQIKPGTNYKIQVDSGPGCERLFALLAGVGWQGKNNFIIVPGYGSFVWLGLLTTDLELPPDQPVENLCGQCNECLRACPTKAYAQPNQFDHNLCMAYWAADKKELSPEQCRILSKHGIIYGCDLCQLACPHNRPGEAEDGDVPSLAQIITMSRGEFEAWFKQTAAGWRGRNLLRRNAVLAGADNPELRDVLVKLAQGEGMVSDYARAVLGGLEIDE